MRGELKELEAWFVDHGHLDKNWRKDWASSETMIVDHRYWLPYLQDIFLHY